jgi:hypothetical protein
MNNLEVQDLTRFQDSLVDEAIKAKQDARVGGMWKDKAIAQYVNRRYFSQVSGGRLLLWRLGQFGDVVEVAIESIKMDCDITFGSGYVRDSNWFKSNGRDTCWIHKVILPIAHVAYRPNAPKLFKRGDFIYLNKFQPPTIKYLPKAGLPNEDLWSEFLARWFNKLDQREYFEKWLAVTVVNPERQIPVTPILRSEHGTGKNFLVDQIISNLCGHSNVKTADLTQLFAVHADEIYSSVLTCVSEIEAGGNEKAARKLKSIVSDTTVQVNPKGLAAYRTEVFANFIFFSNKEDPIFLEPGDRRYWIPEFLTHCDTKFETADWITNTFKPWLQKGGLQLIRNRLEEVARKVPDDFFSIAQDTIEKDELKHQDVKPDYLMKLVSYLEHAREKEIYVGDLLDLQTVKVGKLTKHDITKALRQAGYKNRKRGSRGEVRCWVKEDVEVVSVNSGCEF